MSVAPMGNLPYCKGLWSVISGTTCRCDKELVEDEIKNATPILRDGLSYFKKFTDASLQAVSKTNPPPRMFDLIGKLAPLLNLDATITWDLVCNFMLYEYRNCAETFASQLTDMTTMKVLIEDIWSFYYMERVTLLKCLKLMVEYRENTKHPHCKQFAEFFDQVLLGSLLESIRKQIEALKFINPPSRSQLFGDEHLHQLYNSSLIEMRELLHIFTVILHDVHTPENQFLNIYGSIGGEPRRLTSSKSHGDKEAVAKKIQDIQYSQAALLLVALDVLKHTGMEDWVRSVRTSMQDTFEHKCIRDSSAQDGPLFLAWMLANYAIDSDNAEILARYRPFGIRAIQLGVFYYLQGLLTSEPMQEKTQYAVIVRNSIYNLLMLLGTFIEEDKLDSFPGLYECCAAALSGPETADRFWQEKDEDAGLRLIFKHAAQWFPYRFEPLTAIVSGLASASTSSAKNVLEVLDDLPSIALEVPRHNFPINSAFLPYERECVIHPNSFTVPRNCRCHRISSSRGNIDREETDVVLWETQANYWDAFHHKIEQLLLEASGGIANVSQSNTPLPNQVTMGFGLLKALLAADVDIPQSMVIPTELSFEVINRFSYPILPLNVYKVVAACISVSSKLVLRYPEDVLSRMRFGVYPRFDDRYQKTTEFAQAVSFDAGLVASWLSSIETIEHTYPILDAYLDTLSNYLIVRHSKEAMYSVEIPGMVLLLQSVLPKLDSWYFRSETERVDLLLKCIYCLHRALDIVPGEKKGESRSELRRIVTYNLLHLEPRHALLKILRTGEKSLRNKMMNETDWLAGKGFKMIKTVQLVLSVVNRLLMYRKNLGLGLEERSPLEMALYASPSLPNGLLIVPTIVDYIHVWFSPALQAMAVRLLKKFAEGFSMSLLVCMGMDGTAIRETFASRLMSPTCDVEVKVAILELVTVCLDKQPGLTEALFNIMHQAERKRIFPRPADEFLTEGCTRFLDLYLERIRKEESIVHDRLFDSTMSLLRAMWYHRNEILVNFFCKRTDFWSNLISPFLRKLVPQVKGYSQLMDIIKLELFKTTTLEKDFVTNVEKLLDGKEYYWEKIAEYVFEAIPAVNMFEKRVEDDLEEEEHVSEKDNIPKLPYEENLESWYQLLVVLTDDRISKKYPIEARQAQRTTSLALERLLLVLKQPPSPSLRVRTMEARLIMLLASVSLRSVSSWKKKCVGEGNTAENLKEKLVDAIQEISQNYRVYGRPLRQTLMALILGCVELVETEISENETVLEYLLGHACSLALGDVQELRESAKTRDRKRKLNSNEHRNNEEAKRTEMDVQEHQASYESIPATLTISLVTRLLRSKLQNGTKSRRRNYCVQLRQLIPELEACIVVTLQKHPYARFSKAGLTLFAIVARSHYEPMQIDEKTMAKLWLALIPPNDIKNSLLDTLYDEVTNSPSLWLCQEWWPIYSAGLELILGLISSPTTVSYVCPVIMFLSSHENQLLEASTLLRHTADPIAADLILSLVNLISALSMKPIFWDATHPSVRETLVKCMYLAYDSTVNLLLRPRILKFIIDGISVESAEELKNCDERQLSGELIVLVNKLILINICCAQSFVRFSPKLNSLIDTIYTEEDYGYAPVAEMNFGPPQMSITSGPKLTYGTIISAAQLFTQAQWHSRSSTLSEVSSTPSGSSSSIGMAKDDKIDLARREWERATPDNLRRMHAKDLHKILHSGSSSVHTPAALLASRSSSKLEFASFLTGHDLTVPLLSSPRLIKRPFDPLICENMILSRATALNPVPGRSRMSRGSSPQVSQSGRKKTSDGKVRSPRGSIEDNSDPWFDSMDENNTRLALEVNLVLLLFQALEGVKSPRLAVRDRQLIGRETATELGVFFEFLENFGCGDNWKIAATVVDADPKRTQEVSVSEEIEKKPPARFRDDSTVTKIPVSWPPIKYGDETDEDSIAEIEEVPEERRPEEVISTGGFNVQIDMSRFLPLLGNLLKSVVDSLDAAEYA